ncbi:uncharacterized protein LOC129571512, partial [Sitodiplosis mosellana]|uniref:uncharacterized protein LOC129571512 n=1 Tax=Sitodiplosis mosellana TaxID=263140 RepID=UPI00244459AB
MHAFIIEANNSHIARIVEYWKCTDRMETILSSHLNYHIKNIIDDSQHGFIKGRSTITNLVEFTSPTLINMEHGIQSEAIYLDLAKAFDSVDINLLIHKLKKVTSGTGQGYPIGATLFILFIIDLPHYLVNSNLQSFADDTRFSMQINRIEDCIALQEDLNRIVEYFKRN